MRLRLQGDLELKDFDREDAGGAAATDAAAGEDDRDGLIRESAAEVGGRREQGVGGAGGERSHGLVVAVHLAKLGHVVPTVLKLMTSLVPLLSSDAALRTLLADNKLLLRLLVDLPLRALQRRSQDTAGRCLAALACACVARSKLHASRLPHEMREGTRPKAMCRQAALGQGRAR
jgi:hypothetical protein